MKVSHFALLFLIFFLAIVIKTDISIGKVKSAEYEKAELTSCLESAISDAANFLENSEGFGTNTIKKDRVIETFFTSLYTAMGIISDNNAKNEIEMYVPVILLCDSDGYYVYYYDDYTDSHGLTYAKRCWTEKIPYCYQDAYFSYRFTLSDQISLYDKNGYLGTSSKCLTLDYHEIQTSEAYATFRIQHSDCILLDDEIFNLAKKGAIVNELEEVMAYYTSKHNMIAKNNGITYNFSFPMDQEEEWANYMDDVNLLVVFQGYPYGKERDYTFNKVVSAGANIIKKPVYYIEQKSWYPLAHIEGCDALKNNPNVLEENYESIEDCVKTGAFCHECIEHGARVPELKN